MKEIWRDIEGYEGYQVSSLGRVKLLDYRQTGKERIMKAGNKKGYLRIGLCKDGKQKFYRVHRLVATAFIPNPDNLPQVNHKDENKTNNRVENLEWCSAEYNSNYGTRTKRSVEKRKKQVLCIETGKIYSSAVQIDIELGLSKGNISKVCLGKHKTCGGFHWCYI